MHHQGNEAFSWTRSSSLFTSWLCDRDCVRILVFQSRTHRDKRSLLTDCDASECESDFFDMRARSRSRPRMGAKDKKDKNTSFRMISGEPNREETDW